MRPLIFPLVLLSSRGKDRLSTQMLTKVRTRAISVQCLKVLVIPHGLQPLKVLGATLRPLGLEVRVQSETDSKLVVAT